METEDVFLAQWCAQSAALRDHARALGVLDRFDADAALVRAGGSARRPLLKWRASAPGVPSRGWSGRPEAGLAGLPGPGREPGVGAGDYTCPEERCVRHARRDDEGHPPRCAVFDLPMRPA